MDLRVARWLLLSVVALSVPAFASQATISGVVKNSSGVPQMGALVQVFAYQTSRVLTVFTDARGFYSVNELVPGAYDVKVSAPSFLPTLRENISLRSGANMVVNVTLNTLSDAIRLLPSKQGAEEEDDWKWTLRSAANRPILRMKNGQPVVISNGVEDQRLKAAVAFVAGTDSEGFGASSDLSTTFKVERSMFQTGLLSFTGDVGYGPGATVLRTSYSHHMPNGSNPEASLTVRRFATSPTMALPEAALEALTASVADSFNVAGFIDLRFGTEFQAVQFVDRVDAVKPFGTIDVHLSPDSVLEYQYATSMPNMRHWKGFDSAPADLSESGPRMSLSNGRPVLERARHQEVSFSRRFGNTAVQTAYFNDYIRNAALTGVGEVGSRSEVLPDVYSGTFSYNAGNLDTSGVRLVVERRLANGLTASVNYAFGGVLDLEHDHLTLAEVRSGIGTSYRHSVATKLAGTLKSSKTQWIASYKWTNGTALTPVDVFNSGPGQADSYLNVFIRQPLPGSSFIPGKLEALVDLRNLLAQGYQPVFGPDGQTVYLVQSARSVRGGLAFVF
jgi:Carboxypeptidase regulatory-like domain